MRYLFLLLLLSCSEPEVMPANYTKMRVTGVEMKGGQCTYSLDIVTPYQPHPNRYMKAECGRYRIGEVITLLIID